MRTTIDTVKQIMKTNQTDSVILTHIKIASRMVTNNLTGKGLDVDTLADIETYLTAHLIAMGKERQVKSKKIDTVQVQYQGEFGEGLKSTSYGQMVLTLDTSDILKNLNKKKGTIKAVRQIDPKNPNPFYI